MIAKETSASLGTNQIATNDLQVPPSSPTVQGQPPASAAPAGESRGDIPNVDPSGASPEFEREMVQEGESKGEDAPGVEAEQIVWEARYSMKNFIGRMALRTLLTIGWIVLAIYTWGEEHTNLNVVTPVLGVALGVAWVALFYRILRARFGHEYRLTNRRLFVSTGLLRRRCDQMELLHVNDVFLRQHLLERWLSLGTVVVVSKEAQAPTFYLAGIDDPSRVMDLVWHCARAEREGKTVQVAAPN